MPKVKESADLRYQDTVPLQKFRQQIIGIAGLGATGKQVAEILAVMGHKQMWGSDPDKIELKNVGTQGWSLNDIGQSKPVALMDKVCNSRSCLVGYQQNFEECFTESNKAKEMAVKTTVFFCCVDKMAARSSIWNRLKGLGLLQGPKIWIESRLASRVIRVMGINLAEQADRDYYETTLYSDSSAFQGRCTDQMTYYGAGIAAGLMVSQLVNWLNYGMVGVRDAVIETVSMGVTILGTGQSDSSS